MTAAFAAGAFATLMLANAIALTATRHRRFAVAGLLLVAFGLAGVSFPADLPGREQSWHGLIHNSLYNLIPLGMGLSMAVRSGASREDNLEWRLAMPCLGVLAICLFLTLVPSIAQAARYGVFAAMLTWILAVAAQLLTSRGAHSTRAGTSGGAVRR